MEETTTKRSRINIKEEETSGELQSYLESFNEDIDGNEQTNHVTTEIVEGDEEEIDNDDEDGGTYFVDQSGNYYYQATKDSEPVPTTPPEGLIIDDIENDIEEEIDNKNENNSNIKISNNNVNRPKTTITKATKDFSYVVIMDDDTETTKIDDDYNDNGNDVKRNIIYDFDENDDIVKAEPIIDSGRVIKLIKKVGGTTIKQPTIGQFECSHCSYVTAKRYLLARHMKSHSDDRPHKCTVCERGFKTLASLQNHLNTHTGKKPHACKYCQSCFTTSGELVRHVRYRHTHEKPHKCTECDYASVELSKLKRHIRCHTGERPYQCPHCTYASPDTFKLKRHLRIHTGEKPYECDICHAKFTQSNSLKAHKLIHSVGEKPVFQCELCPTTCGRKTDLRIHVQKLHTSENPIKCKRCNKLFADRYTYKVHAKTHDGEKCYKCELCPYASISQRHLESHVLIHTDQKPYECQQCEQTFRQKQLLRRHINLYHNKNYIPPEPKAKIHACPHCGRNFSHKGNLIRHMASHDPDTKIRDEAYKLKLGRQKRVRVVDGETVEVYEMEDDDDGDENEIEMEFENDGEGNNRDISAGETIFIKEENKISELENEDDHQYVVLEVIQCDDGEDGGVGNSNSTKIENDIEELDENEYILSDLQDDEGMNSFDSTKQNNPLAGKHDEDMSNCFGFQDDGSEMEENVEDEKHHKSTIKLLEILN